MTAPDKIYLHGYPLYDEPCAEWAEVPFYGQFRGQQAETVEYIRKDTLIEWANSWLAFKRSGIVLDDGFSYAMEELIKKLNEM